MGIMALSFTAYLFADPSPTLPNLGKFLKGQVSFMIQSIGFLERENGTGVVFVSTPVPFFKYLSQPAKRWAVKNGNQG